MDILGLKLRRLREVKGVSREVVADYLHIDPTTYGRYESGQAKPPTDKLKGLAAFHEVSVDALLSPDPMGFTIHNNNCSQVGSGPSQRFVQHVVSEEFVREVFDRIDKLMERQDAVNEKLVAMLATILKAKH